MFKILRSDNCFYVYYKYITENSKGFHVVDVGWIYKNFSINVLKHECYKSYIENINGNNMFYFLNRESAHLFVNNVLQPLLLSKEITGENIIC